MVYDYCKSPESSCDNQKLSLFTNIVAAKYELTILTTPKGAIVDKIGPQKRGMPCESCHVQFTVFRRKRSCADCKRFYCSSCLSTSKRRTTHNEHASPGVQLCKRCVIFAKRPLLRTDLLQLKPKDLIFYLQSKHISTAGCVEKDELVGLVLTHVNEADVAAGNSEIGGTRSYADPSSNPYDSLKQTCQNFFTSITENISDSLNSFDHKDSSKPGDSASNAPHPGRGSMDSTTVHILDQPRVSTREIPSYAVFQQQNNNNRNTQQSTSISLSTTSTNPNRLGPTSPTVVSSSISSVTTKGTSQTSVSPEISINSLERCEAEQHPCASRSNRQRSGLIRQEAGEENSDCECSDDDLIATFSRHSLPRKNELNTSDREIPRIFESEERIGNKSRASTEFNGGEISSQSSFEELGAIGGISDESKAATDTNSSNMEQWQILDSVVSQSVAEHNSVVSEPNCNVLDDTLNSSEQQPQAAVPLIQQTLVNNQVEATLHIPAAPQRLKKVARRRSDSYLNRQRQRPASEDDSPTGSSTRNAIITLAEQDVEMADKGESSAPEQKNVSTKSVSSCQRCGKHKATLRKQVEKMRRHLESAQLPEAEIKRELQDFLVYLEQRAKSMECSDTETVESSLSGRNYTQSPEQQRQRNVWEEANMSHWEYQLDDNEGIHVYAGPTSDIDSYCGHSSRFIKLDDFKTIEDLEALSVKQLKEVLMLNRVDYKGCCEKQELLDRVQRLWKNFRSTPAVDKLQTDELCKICMDAPIECVILECGHMATCTNCGKVLSECPICRQYIVRVVRFFRA